VLGFVVARWAASFAAAAALGLLAALSPVAIAVIQDPSEISVGIWILGIVFPWIIGRAAARREELTAELDATRRELAQQALEAERRRIARDVHDFVGHGLAAMMLQVTSARHVLHRDPAAAEEALRSAEEVGRHSMRELRRTVALLRSDGDDPVPPPLPSASEIGALVEHARAGGLEVELRTDGELARIAPGIGVAIYRIAQEALANAARHAPRARTVLALDVRDGWASLVAETTGPTIVPAGEPERQRYGVIGMRERATALGGELNAGPTPEGWRVSCRLPLETTSAVRR
jgi:signal transduction histidine kinase